jgi:hypothetical protein
MSDMNDDFKVCCEYCDSYVDAGENEVCPNCGGSLREAIIREETKRRLEKIDEEEKQRKILQEEREAKDRDDIFDLIKSVAGSAAGGAIAGGLARAAGEFLKEDLKGAFKKK